VALTVSPAIRVVALIGLLLAVGLGGAMRLMGGSADSATAVVPSKSSAITRAKSVGARASARAEHPTVPGAATHKARATHKTTAAKTAAAAKPKLTPAPAEAAVKPTHAPRKVSPALAAGLPLSLAQGLAVNRVVVAVVYNPQSEVDGVTMAEARAGAAMAGAGFVGLNVLSQAELGKLTERFGLLPDPAILVFRRPTHLAARIDGFADKETVAQAAENAAHGS
jgi:hypothetical protein